MFKFLRKKQAQRAQSTLEYVVLIVLVVAALLSMQFYIKRGIQGRLRSVTDDIGEQFSPGNTNVIINTVSHSNTVESFINGVTSSNLLDTETTNTIINQYIINTEIEYFGPLSK